MHLATIISSSVDGSSSDLNDAAISRITDCATLAAIPKFENAIFLHLGSNSVSIASIPVFTSG